MPRPRSPNPTPGALRARLAYARSKIGMKICRAGYDHAVTDWLIDIGMLTEAQLNQSDKKLGEDMGQIFTDIMAHLARTKYCP